MTQADLKLIKMLTDHYWIKKPEIVSKISFGGRTFFNKYEKADKWNDFMKKWTYFGWSNLTSEFRFCDTLSNIISDNYTNDIGYDFDKITDGILYMIFPELQ